jgi:hypothetical protein
MRKPSGTIAVLVLLLVAAVPATAQPNPLGAEQRICVEPTDDAEDCDLVAASATGNASDAFVSVSVLGNASGEHALAVDGDATGATAVSAFGNASSSDWLALSGTGDADCRASCPLVAASAAGDAASDELLTASVLGDAECGGDPCTTVAASVLGDAYGNEILAASVAGEADCGPRGECALVAVAGDDSARGDQATFSGTGTSRCQTDDCVAVAGLYNAYGDIAVSVFGDAYGDTAGVSVFQCAEGDVEVDRCDSYVVDPDDSVVGEHAAVSGTGDAACTAEPCVAVAGLGNANCAERRTHSCAAVSGDGKALGGIAAVSLTGPFAKADHAAIAGEGDATCRQAGPCAAVSGEGVASGREVAVSGSGQAIADRAAVTGPDSGRSQCRGGQSCAAIGVDGPSRGNSLAVSGEDRATCRTSDCVSVSGQGTADGGLVAVGGGGEAIAQRAAVSGPGGSRAQCAGGASCAAIGVGGVSRGNTLAASGFGDSECRSTDCVAVSGTGDAEGGLVAASGTGEASCSADPCAAVDSGTAPAALPALGDAPDPTSQDPSGVGAGTCPSDLPAPCEAIDALLGTSLP